MYIDGESFAPNSETSRITVHSGSYFTFSATSNAWPNQPVNIELVNENTSGDNPARFVNGVVFPNNEGNFKIVCTVNNYLVNTLYFTVLPYVRAAVSLDYDSIVLNEGDSFYIDAKVNEDATNKRLTYTSSDPNIARVDNNIITAVSAGITKITIFSVDGAEATLSIKVRGSIEKYVYDFTDFNNKKHTLTVYTDVRACLDNVYEFEYNFKNGNEWYSLVNDEDIGFSIVFDNNVEKLECYDYTDGGTLFFCGGPVWTQPGKNEEVFTLNATASSQGISQGGSEISIVPSELKFLFLDIDGIVHSVTYVEKRKITIDGRYEFIYIDQDQYVFGVEGSEPCFLRCIKIKSKLFLLFFDTSYQFFSKYGEIPVEEGSPIELY